MIHMNYRVWASVTVKIYLPVKLYPQYIFTYENQSKTYWGYVFASGKIIPRYIFAYENQSKTYKGYVFASGKIIPPITYLLSENIPPV